MKEYTSQVEGTREKFEEPINTTGKIVRVEQIWRHSNLLPEEAPSVRGALAEEFAPKGTYKTGVVYSFNDGAKNVPLLTYFSQLPIDRVPGTKNCFSSPSLQNIMTEDFNKSYEVKYYVDGHRLAYGVGAPIVDAAAGTIYFTSKEFVESNDLEKLTVSFYRYVGGLGNAVNDIGADLPFRDDIEHFKDATDDSRTATFKVRGGIKNTEYIMPSEEGKWYDKEDAENTGVILLQENLEDTLWEQNTKISGGNWGTSGVTRYAPPNVGGTQVVTPEPHDKNH